MQIDSKLPEVSTSIFAVMSKMANDHKAINLSQGFPDFPVSKELIKKVDYYMSKGLNQYAPMPGVPELRQQIALFLEKKYKRTVSPDTDITITAGATEALFATIQALVNVDDEVILFDPAYDSYAPAIRLAGGIPKHLQLKAPDFAINWEKVRATITNKTRLIFINSPHNPSGAILSANDLNELQKIAVEHDLLVLSDEVYEHIIFDRKKHESVLLYPQLAERSVAVFSFGKTFHATGWKVGYLIAPENISVEIRKVHQFLTFSVNTPVQHALADFLKDASNYENLPDLYQTKRDFFANALKDSKFEVMPCGGTYFQLLNYAGISDKREVDMAEYLTKEYGVASIPVSVFYKDRLDNKVLRFCFAKSEETLAKAAEILCRI